MRARRAAALAATLRIAVLGLVVGTSSCGGLWRWPWGQTQRWPGPMEPLSDPLPSGDRDLYKEGPEEMLVLRHADPCQVRPAGYASSFPLTFVKKQLGVHSGSCVYTAPGGRLEVLWPDGSSVILLGRGAGILGSKSRGEPLFVFQEVERAEIELKEHEVVELVGGSQLSAKGGPFQIERLRSDLVRLKNQSKGPGEVAYRDALFHLDPGQIVDLPLGSTSAAPRPAQAGWNTAEHEGLRASWQGQLETLDEAHALGLRALGEHEIRALGLRVRLERDEEVRFQGLGELEPRKDAGAGPAPDAGAPTPEHP